MTIGCWSSSDQTLGSAQFKVSIASMLTTRLIPKGSANATASAAPSHRSIISRQWGTLFKANDTGSLPWSTNSKAHGFTSWASSVPSVGFRFTQSPTHWPFPSQLIRNYSKSTTMSSSTPQLPITRPTLKATKSNSLDSLTEAGIRYSQPPRTESRHERYRLPSQLVSIDLSEQLTFPHQRDRIDVMEPDGMTSSDLNVMWTKETGHLIFPVNY